VAASVAAASCVAALAGGGSPGAAHASANHSAITSAAAAGTGASAAGPAGSFSLSGANAAMSALSLPQAAGGQLRGSQPTPTGNDSAQSTSQVVRQASATLPRLIVPDIIAAAPGGVTRAELAKIRRLSQVRNVLAIDGARITVNGKPVTALGASASALRPWTPPATAASQQVWSDFAAGDLITTAAAARNLKLTENHSYPVTAGVRASLRYGTRALLGVAGVDAIVDEAQASRLGLVQNVAVLINAPAADMNALAARVRQALGRGGQVIRLVPVDVSTNLPVTTRVPTGRPSSYLALYQESAAQYCPGLSWTVLAAIGQIESGNGANVGPSSAGALGPMQFLPSTWREWGIDGFGDTGAPDIMNPFDAVPSAARMLCADGAAKGGQGLRQAIFDYNHANWYVDEVLALATEYAGEFG
jgi:transglycosylase-like protein with SLT domain